MIHQFIISEISHIISHVYLYDERDLGKGADQLCEIRVKYHLALNDKINEAKVSAKLSMSLLDNCVGENKSVVVM